MKKISIQPLLAFICIFLSGFGFAQSFSEYVNLCKQELGFDSIPQMDCRSVNFRLPTKPDFDSSIDWVAHRRINDSVDAVFACRWVDETATPPHSATGEMIVHNRKTGGTCFFEQKDTTPEQVNSITKTTNPASPTDKDAAKFWETPTRVCTGCHSAGPYIASPEIVGALAKFGLINDGHDTFGRIYHAIEPVYVIDKRGGIYYPNPILNNAIKDTVPGCATACHVIADTNIDNAKFKFGPIVFPSINLIIDDVIQNRHMRPTDPYSDYRWLNRDTPGGTGDDERLSSFRADIANGKTTSYPFICDNPSKIQMHRVGSSVTLSPSTYLRTFNLQDGLVCYNSDFPEYHPYKCFNYETRYKCDGDWTEWKSTDSPSDKMDNEARSRFKGLCKKPTDIQARYKAPVSGTPWVSFYGPRDRFAQFDNKGLLCKNADQDNGKCNNYVVRFICN